MRDELNVTDYKTLDDIVFSMNTASSVETIQEKTLNQLRELVPYECATFFLPERGAGPNLLGSPVVVDCDSCFIDEYKEYYQQMDYLLWIFRLNEALTYRETDLIKDPLRQKSAFFNQYIKSHGLYYVSGVSLVHNQVLCGAITLYRAKKSGDFNGRSLAVLSHLQRHLGNRLYQLLYSVKETPTPQAKTIFNPIEQILTRREREIANLIFTGLDTEKMAVLLHISPKTVKKHIDNIFKKTNIHSRLQLVRIMNNSSF